MKKLLLIATLLAVFQYKDALLQRFTPAAGDNREVVLYATAWCGYCAKTRRFFAEHGIRYREIDIEKSASGRQAYEALGGGGVPLLTIGDTRIRGYNPA
ncbi:TPA: glutaredoxin family protein, partial [Klebsiella pneumoniae]